MRFLVTEMAFGPEVLLGALRDPVAGPTVTVAVGGWAAEAGATLGTIVGAPGRRGARGAGARLGPAAAARRRGGPRTSSPSWSASRRPSPAARSATYGTVEINPLILAAGGPVIVDALLVEEEP